MNTKSLLTRIGVPVLSLGLLGGLGATLATSASASVLPKVASGAVELGSPLQYESFLAIQDGMVHGAVDYTNWAYPEPGSGTWAPADGPHALVTTFQGTPYAHTLNGGLTVAADSNDRLSFSGTGEFNGAADAGWSASGHVTDNKVTFKITYNGTYNPGYTATATGTIAANGSASGTMTSSLNQAGLTWTMPAGSFSEVLHYVAPVSSASVDTAARSTVLAFTIPASVPGLAGTLVTVSAHDGGPGFASDTYAHNGTSYPVIGGPGISVP